MATVSAKRKKDNIFLRMRPIQRLMISLVLAVLTYALISQTGVGMLIKVMVAWEVFALFYIITSWIVFFSRTPGQIREHSRQQDGSRLYVFLLILFTSFASLFTVLLLILSKDAKDTPHIIYIPVAVSGMLLSWIMVHTLFGFHYAHLYYGDDTDNPSSHAEGLEFPKEKKPDYLDFTYFSFVIGMTFQVSDIDITARPIRRLALLHGLLSFGLNTFVVALTINLIAGLMKLKNLY
jgi:uncharacterized membrane protein